MKVERADKGSEQDKTVLHQRCAGTGKAKKVKLHPGYVTPFREKGPASP